MILQITFTESHHSCARQIKHRNNMCCGLFDYFLLHWSPALAFRRPVLMTGSRTTRSLSLEARIAAPRCAFRPLPIRSDGPSSCFVVFWFCWCSPLAGASTSLVLLVRPSCRSVDAALLWFCRCIPLFGSVSCCPSCRSVGADLLGLCWAPPLVLLARPLLWFCCYSPSCRSIGAAPTLVLLVQPLLWFCWCSLSSGSVGAASPLVLLVQPQP